MWIRERTTWVQGQVWVDVGKRMAKGIRSVYMDCTRLWGGCEGMREECGDMGSAARVGNVGKGLRDKGKWGKWK